MEVSLNMNTKDCLYFITISETRSFSKAAEQLYVSQPYISRWVARLEGQLGVQLFDRSNYPIRLSKHGIIFLGYARKFIELENEAYKHISDGKSASNVLSIGATELTGTYILPIVVTQILKKYPDIQVVMTEKPTHELERRVENGQLDLAFICAPNHHPKIEYEIVSRCRVIMVVPPRNKLYQEDMYNNINPVLFKAKNFKESRFLVSSMTPAINYMAMQYLKSLNLSSVNFIEKGTIEQTLKQCINGNQIAFVPDISISYSITGMIPNYYDIGDQYRVNVAAIYKRKQPEIQDAIQWTHDHWSDISSFPEGGKALV